MLPQKRQTIERKVQKREKSKAVTMGYLIGRVFGWALIAGTMTGTYIYMERYAQAAFDGQSRSRAMMIYESRDSVVFIDKRKIIVAVLLNRGVEENLSLQIAEAVVEESRKTSIPMQMYLAIMKTESTFRPAVVSSAYAKGIMQIQPGTWDAYVEKHNLPVTREHMFDPRANIMVASVILKELYDNYMALGHQEPDVWHYVLAAYFAGPASLKNGIKSYHWRYIEKVKRHYHRFESLIAV